MRALRYFALLLSAVIVFGCIEENFEDRVKVNSGDAVIFGVRAGFENNDKTTKTVYGGNEDTYELNGRTFERVYWLPGDKVMIHCDQGNQVAHYQVAIKEQAIGSSLEKMQLHGVANNGIQWKNIQKYAHTFYAVYPSPYQFSTPNVDSDLLAASDYQNRIKVEGDNLRCYLPVSQAPLSIDENNGHYVAHPNMNYAYMIAKATVDAGTTVPSSISMNFYPIVTALEVTMTVPSVPEGGIEIDNTHTVTGYDAIQISNVEISSVDKTPIVGSFSLNMKDYAYNHNGEYPDVTNLENENSHTSVSVLTWKEGNPISIPAGGSLKFTVFLQPQVLEKNLEVTITTANNVYRTAQLNNVTIEAHKKQFVTGLQLPANPIINEEQIEAEGSNWVTQLDPATYMEGLSIPGTANSFSYNYNDEGSEYYKTQTLDFETQWNLGVRCFELVSDRANTNNAANLGSQDLRCNNQPVGQTVKGAVDEIIKKSIAAGEFAMIIFTYQPQGGGNAARNPVKYMEDLKTFYKGYTAPANAGAAAGKKLSELTTIYSPNLRVGDLKEKPIMLVARPSQEGEDTPDNINNATAEGYNILTVKGWGSLQDKWSKRGYPTTIYRGVEGTTTKIESVDKIQSHADLPSMEDWIYGKDFIVDRAGLLSTQYGYLSGGAPLDNDGTPIARPKRDAAKIDFTYQSDKDFAVWAQEWRRVSDQTKIYSWPHTNSGLLGSNNINRTADWIESRSEKEYDIIDCLKRSIAKENNRVYFNSLDGFYIIDDEMSYDHYWRGNMGDIASYAQYINNWFYPELLNYAKEGVTGPLGVIIMDYVSTSGAGSNLPQTIIQNNFMFNVPKDPNYNPGQ